MNSNPTGFRWVSEIVASLCWMKVASAFEGLRADGFHKTRYSLRKVIFIIRLFLATAGMDG